MALNLKIIVVKNGMVTREQILEEVVCIPLRAYALRKGINLSLLLRPPSYD